MTSNSPWGLWALILVAIGGLFYILACTELASAETEGNLCADLDGNEAVTGADLSMVASVIGQAVPPADPWVDLAPDNAITGGDLSVVAAVIGQKCWLHGGPDTQGDSAMESTMGVFSCRFLTYGFFTHQPANGYILIDDWGGRSYCFSTQGLFVSGCLFEFEALYPDENPQWQLVATTETVENGGTYCAAYGHPAYLPCGRLLLGKLYHWIRNDSGSLVHGPHTHSEAEFGSMGFSVC